jgi:hypothetical protein
MKYEYTDEHRREDEHYERLGELRREENKRHERRLNVLTALWLLCTVGCAVIFIWNPAFWFVLVARIAVGGVAILLLVIAYKCASAAIRGTSD